MNDSLLKSIESADKVLIGIGEAFCENYQGLLTDEFAMFAKDEPLQAGYQMLNYLHENKNVRIQNAYKKLYDMAKEKDYFVITTCTDDSIYASDLNEEKIVAPCGTFRYLQCPDNCSNELLPVTTKMTEERQRILCPYCQKEVQFNKVGVPKYNESGYLPQWRKYTKWLQQTINKQLCIIELGVSLDYPTVIRWPFEKVVYFNKKAILYRVNETLYQLPADMKEKGISIKEDPVQFLTE